MSDDRIKRLTMPKWGLTMTQGTVVKWLVEEGSEIEEGSEVVEIETEKIASAAEAPVGGVLRRQVAKEGQAVPVAGLLGVLAGPEVSDEEIDRFVGEFASTFVPEEVEGLTPERVEVDGRSLRYLKRGEGGEAVVLLHGLGGDLNNWLFNHEVLAAGRAVYALDLPGHGESSKDVGDGTLNYLGAAVAGFMGAVGLSSAHLVGHSLGGAVAMNLALERPLLVSSVTLISSAGLGPEINGGYIQGFIDAGSRREIRPHLQTLFADPSLVNRQFVENVLKFKRLDGVEAALNSIAASFISNGTQAAVLRGQIGEISAPVLVVWGEEDRIIPASHAKGLPASIEVEIVSGAGHMVQMEAAAEVNRALQRFLGS